MSSADQAHSASRNAGRLSRLSVGQVIPFGGDRAALVGEALAQAFTDGDRLVVVQDGGDLLHIPAAEHARVSTAVGDALLAFGVLAAVSDEQITQFFDVFATRLADDAVYAAIGAANEADVASALARGRSTTRLRLSPSMREGMIAGLHVWRDAAGDRNRAIDHIDHGAWAVETFRAPLGVVGFVFEGRPNVFADATGVLRTGNTVVFRIGSDALGTARAIMHEAVTPALAAAGLPAGCVRLVDSAAHAAGWALFADERLSLAVARGSGAAVAQLGAVARQHGVPVSLHGTGGAWLIAGADADPETLALAVEHSLDRKVCNTMNVCVVLRSSAEATMPAIETAARAAADRRGAQLVLHATASAAPFVTVAHDLIDERDLATEWEWEDDPEFSVVVVDSVEEGVDLFNRWSPHFGISLVGDDDDTRTMVEARADAPFVGNGFTRWVDGQFAFDQPELGLSNWQSGRLFARGGVLSGDSVFTVRTRATVRDHSLHR